MFQDYIVVCLEMNWLPNEKSGLPSKFLENLFLCEDMSVGPIRPFLNVFCDQLFY